MAGKVNNSGSNDIMAEINMTPLIDVMLVLVIIFMVNATAAIEQAFNVDLPQAGETAPVKEPESLVVTLSKDGRLAIGGDTVKQSEFEEKMKVALQKMQTKTVLFAGDTKAEFGKAVALMDVAKRAGATSFSIAAEGQ